MRVKLFCCAIYCADGMVAHVFVWDQGLRHAFEIGGYDMRPVEGIPPPKTEKFSDLGHYFSKMVQIHIKK